MRHIWSILCKKSIIDADTNNISLNEALEEVAFNIPLDKDFKLPTSFNFDYELVSFWTSDKPEGGEKFYFEIEFVDPDKKSLNKLEREIVFPENKKRLRTRIKSNSLSTTKEGEYIFKIKAKKEKNDKYKILTEIPLTIVIKRVMSRDN
jgi:hypothetical protein